MDMDLNYVRMGNGSGMSCYGYKVFEGNMNLNLWIAVSCI